MCSVQIVTPSITHKITGSGGVWSPRFFRKEESTGSNPVSPTSLRSHAEYYESSVRQRPVRDCPRRETAQATGEATGRIKELSAHVV